jgi:hypothetical protein
MEPDPHGADVRVLGRPYNPHAVRLTAEGFGSLVNWDELQVHRHECFGFKAGMKAAERLSTILVGVVDDLLSEIRQREAKNPKAPSVPQQNAAVGQAFSVWTNLVQNNFTTFGKANVPATPRARPGFTDPAPLTIRETQSWLAVTQPRMRLNLSRPMPNMPAIWLRKWTWAWQQGA